MLFDGLIQRKLASVLRPWLLQEPELEVNLGFFRSIVVARNICFDTAALNRLIGCGDGEEVRPLLRSVTIEEVCLRVAHLSAPAFTVEVRGVDVALSTERGSQRRVCKRVEKSFDDYLEERKQRMLAQIDPEGTALHDSMKTIMVTTTWKERLKTSITNLILAHSCLHLHDAHVRVEFPVLDGKFSWQCSIRELNAESSHKGIGCLLSRFIGLVFVPFREISYSLQASVLEIGGEKKDHSRIIYCANPHFGIKLKDLHLVSVVLSVPEMNFSFSPSLLQMIIAFSNIFYIEYKDMRSGRLLWEIARSKIHNVLLPPGYLLYKVILVAVLWLRLVKEYQHFLASVGYSENGLKMSNGTSPRRAKRRWDVISEIEKDLPAEALASARRVARYRVAWKGTTVASVDSHFNSFWRLFFPLTLIWGAIMRIFVIIMTIFLPYSTLLKNVLGQHEMVAEVSDSRQSFFLRFGKISAVICSSNAICPPVHKVSNVRNRNPSRDLFAFGLTVREFLFIFEEGICRQRISFSAGFLEVISAPPCDCSETANNSSGLAGALEGSLKGRLNDSKTIIWGEPALMCIHSEKSEAGSFFKQMPAEIELLQEKLHSIFQEIQAHYSTNPWALCDIQTFRLYPGVESADSGFLKCNLLLGKLNFALGYSSLLAFATFMWEMKHAVSQFGGPDDVLFQEHSCRTFQQPLKMDWSRSLKAFVKQKTMRLSKILPNKHVELRVVAAGPCIQISLRNEELSSNSMEENVGDGSDGINLTIDVHDSEFAIWSMAQSAVATCGESQRTGDSESEFFKLEEAIMNERHLKLDNENYASKGKISLCSVLTLGGLDAYFEDSVENRMLRFLILKPLTAKSSSLRVYVHSFGGSAVTSSLSLSGAMTGVIGLFYMDELCVIFQVVKRLISAASRSGPVHSGLGTSNYFLEIDDYEMPLTEPGIEEAGIEIDEGEAENLESAVFIASASFQLVPFNIILHNSRNGAEKKDFSMIFGSYGTQNLGLAELPDSGIWLSIEKTRLDVSVQETKVAINADFHGFHATLFKYKDQIGNADKPEVEDTVPQCSDCLDEIFLSDCTFALLLGCLNDSDTLNVTDNATSSNNPRGLLSDSLPSTIHIIDLSPKSIQDNGFDLDGSVLALSPWLLTKITIGMVFMGMCSIKDSILKLHPVDEMHLLLSVGGDLQSICAGIQGGSIFIEAAVLARFTLCLTSYLQFIGSLLYTERPHTKPVVAVRCGSNVSCHDHDGDPPRRRGHLARPVKWDLLEALSTNLSQFSLVILSTDESGVIKEIIVRADFSVKLWLENGKKKFSADLCDWAILSQIIDADTGGTEINIHIPHFSSLGSSYESLWLNHEDSAATFLRTENSSVLSGDASCSRPPNSMEASSTNNSGSLSSQGDERYGNCILERLAISILAEKPLLRDEDCEDSIIQGWVGNGSVAGLNVTISLSEIQMLVATAESLSEVMANSTGNYVEERNWASINQEPQKDLEEAMPDGIIVAIQDAHQHMYVTVENVGIKYKLAGAVHYSVAGKRALFRVKWQKQRRWNSVVSWFSLISLYAKSDSGDPLRLNYCASSAFVDISSNKDDACALWKTVSCKRGNYEDDVDLDPLNHLFKNNFYLVNKKNDCGTAFIDGAFEFVKKPGNPFKFKLLHSLNGWNISNEVGITPSITLTIEEVSFTIAHELSDPKDRFPLLQGYINDTEVKVQVLSHKTRVMSTFTMMFRYFDVHRVLWRELVHPFETSIYCRLVSTSEAEISDHGLHSHLYVGMKELNLSLTERSLDILLYVVGKLDLAGPFAVKGSVILANCCKVENQSELNLLCHFHDSQSARVSRRQSAFFCLRHRVHQPLEVSYATMSLEIPGISSTTSINVPLSRTQIFAWRTRVMSLQDARTYPGPFIVFDVSRTAEEGLSISVSPLLRICNETGFKVELRIQRPEQMEADFASVLLREGESVDDCVAAFDAIKLSGGPKKALLSLGVGNFVFSFRPDIKGEGDDSGKAYSAEWSDSLKGGKAVRLSGVIDKFSYQVRKALSAQPWKYSFSTTSCSLQCGNASLAKMHFLVQSIGRDVPIVQPHDTPESRNSAIALQEQKEIFLLPTVRVSNLLESDIDVLLSETEMSSTNGLENISWATLSCGLTVNLYANPAIIYFTLTLRMFGSSCKPVNCGQWLKRLSNKKEGIQFLDIDLEFCGGKYFACLRLERGERGILEAVVFTQYSLRNDTDFPLFCTVSHLKPSSREVAERLATTTSPHLGSFLPPGSVRSWFMKSAKLRVKLLDEETSESILDLDALSGLAEMSFTKVQESGFKHLIKLGITLGPLTSKMAVPSRLVSIVPRYVISNESSGQIMVRQCFIQDDLESTVDINSRQKTALLLRAGSSDKQDISVFDKLLRKHRISDNDASIFVQFKPNETGLDWSGPVCVAALGRFFLKFRRSSEPPVQQSDLNRGEHGTTWEFASVHVVKEASTFVLHFHRPPDTGLPYRIENHLHDASITYYQKDTFVPETLAPGGRADYVWDDLTRPHRLMVKINGFHMLREISLDKLRPWKPFLRVRQQRDLASDLPIDGNIADQTRTSAIRTNGIDVKKIGYEVYANGPTRVLRISDMARSGNGGSIFQSCKKVQFRISYCSIHLLECCKKDLPKDVDPNDLSGCAPIIVGRLENISLDAIFIDQRKYNQIRVQTLSIDEKWTGAPFAAMLRRHLTSSNATDDHILFIVFVLYPTSSDVREVKYSCIVIQPIDLNLDEATMMKIVPFLRKSLSSSTRSQQYYFDHFEIHPIKIIASFLPDDSYLSYSSGQEALRSLLHSVIKVPAIKNVVVELNGVLVTHALVTTRELLLRCAQHYSWYAMRAIYIAKGSPLLPPTFASVFDDLASSSLDAFFDPSSSLFNVRGLTLGTFKLISKCIENKGFSGTKRYFGDLSQTLRNAGSNILFAALTEISDSMLKGAESSGLNGMVTGFHHGILKLAMEPSVLGAAFIEGGPDRKIMLDRSPGVDELYIEGYLQAMLDTIYKQEYLRVKVIENQVILKNLPPNSALIGEIMDRVKEFLASKALLKGDFSTRSHPLRRLRGEHEWRIGPTILTLCEHLFVSFAIRMLRKQTDNVVGQWKLKEKWIARKEECQSKGKHIWRWGIGRFVLSAMVAYVDGRLCRHIPHPIARRIVSGFLLSFLDNKESN